MEDVTMSDLEEMEKACPDAFFCPITKEIMRDPVILCSDGHTYEYSAISEWFKTGRRIAPLTGKRVISTNVTPNHTLKKAISQFIAEYPEQKRQGMDPATLLKIIELREKDLETMINKQKNINIKTKEYKNNNNNNYNNNSEVNSEIKYENNKNTDNIAWRRYYSNKNSRYYWYNKKTGESKWDIHNPNGSMHQSVIDFLSNINQSKYIKVFALNEIYSMDTVKSLTENDVKEMIDKVGPRRVIYNEIQNYKNYNHNNYNNYNYNNNNPQFGQNQPQQTHNNNKMTDSW